MTSRKQRLLAALADGEFHSGQQLAAQSGVSRTAVWKHLRSLSERGVELESVRGRGYRLKRPLDLLNGETIRTGLADDIASLSLEPEILFETVSTNQYLLERFESSGFHGRVVLAEYQTGGRGRGANKWLSAPASGICLSIGWHYDATPDSLTALSLAAGVATSAALEQAGCRRVQLKWPNDIVVDGAKLGGILIESRGQIAASCDVVIGIGINIHLPAEMAGRIDRETADLYSVLGQDMPPRSLIASMLISQVVSMLEIFGKRGFSAFIERWRALDYTRGKSVVLTRTASECTGRVIDIDDQGLLILSINGQEKKFSSGELSLRFKQ